MRSFGTPRLRLQLEIEYADGHRQQVVSDESWKMTDQGPVRALARDVVDAILFLESAPYITGEVLHVDGGQIAGH